MLENMEVIVVIFSKGVGPGRSPAPHDATRVFRGASRPPGKMVRECTKNNSGCKR